MLAGLTRYWWAFLVRGLFAVVLGVLMYTWPTISLATLIIVFGIYALADGTFLVVKAIGNWAALDDRWLLLFEGLVGIGIGAYCLLCACRDSNRSSLLHRGVEPRYWLLGDSRCNSSTQGDQRRGMVDSLWHRFNRVRGLLADLSRRRDSQPTLAPRCIRDSVWHPLDCVGH